MPTYAIGDIQGCHNELLALLELVNFNSAQDTLWVTGDIVNRGPDSLESLRFVKNLPNKVVVLGNHDLHLLALSCGHTYEDHSLQAILSAPDRAELIDWLRIQPLVHYDANYNYAMVHAGLPPSWDIQQAMDYAAEVEVLLHSPNYAELIQEMYGDTPAQWRPNLRGWDRLRFIINALTRIRFCSPSGELDLTNKGQLGSQQSNYLPWFQIPNRASQNDQIIFGHWAALEGKAEGENVYALDTGCVWGGSLTAMRLEDGQRFSVPCGRG